MYIHVYLSKETASAFKTLLKNLLQNTLQRTGIAGLVTSVNYTEQCSNAFTSFNCLCLYYVDVKRTET
jgi:hypothetical protein